MELRRHHDRGKAGMAAVSAASADPGRIEALRRQVERLLVDIEVPGPGYDPARGSDAELARYRLPPRPDQVTEPEEYRLWVDLFSRPPNGTLNFIRPQVEIETDISYRHHVAAPGSTRYEGSHNWSGAYLVPSDGRRFQRIAASWRVPEANPPLPTGDETVAKVEYRCSSWVGLDGHRGFAHGLPQIGTEHFVTVAGRTVTQEYHLWWQWWAREQKIPPARIPNMPIRPGQRVSCWLTVVRPDQVLLHVRNHCSGDFATLLVDGPGHPDGIPNPIVLGSTAEWITERPTRLESDELYPLPDYGEVVFEDCRAWSGPASGDLHVRHSLDAARLIRMYERQDEGRRATFLSMAKRPSGSQQVRTLYRGHTLWPE